MDDSDSNWSQKGATLSDKSTRKEYGLTQQEIIAAIRAGKLQFRESNMHGNPWYRLLRQEVESLVQNKSGQNHLNSGRSPSLRSGIVICVLQASYPVLATDERRRSAKPRLP